MVEVVAHERGQFVVLGVGVDVVGGRGQGGALAARDELQDGPAEVAVVEEAVEIGAQRDSPRAGPSACR